MRGSCTEKMENHRFRRAENSAFPLCISAEIGNSTSTKYQKTCTLSSHTSACYSIMVLQMVNDNTLEGFHGEKQHTGKLLPLLWVAVGVNFTQHETRSKLPRADLKNQSSWVSQNLFGSFFFFFFSLVRNTSTPATTQQAPAVVCFIYYFLSWKSTPFKLLIFVLFGGFWSQHLNEWMQIYSGHVRTEQNRTKPN